MKKVLTLLLSLSMLTTMAQSALITFTAPIVKDTIHALSFEVYVQYHGNDSLVCMPEMAFKADIGDTSIYDTLTMVYDNYNIWKVSSPQYYYGATVTYSITIHHSDSSITLTDSTFLMPGTDMDTINLIGNHSNYYSPCNLSHNYNWSRQIYLSRELQTYSKGGLITKIAWRYTDSNSHISHNQACYMMATDDSVVTKDYINPINNNSIQQVWSGDIAWNNGWCEITLDSAFFLPADKNLMIFWENRHGKNYGYNYKFYHHSTPNNSAAYNYSDVSFPLSSGNITNYRPDIQLTICSQFAAYHGTDIGIVKILEPITEASNLCTPQYTSVKACLVNMGDNIYHYDSNNVTFNLEVSSPIHFFATKTLRIGTLKSGEMDTIEITSLLPNHRAGAYSMKIWLQDNQDLYDFDDTIYHSYISGKMELPIDIDFSNGMSSFFKYMDNKGTTDGWVTINDSNRFDKVRPLTCNAMIKFDGSRGSFTQLYSCQLNLNKTSNPTLDFWYWHDTSSNTSPLDYTDVRLTLDGGQTFTTLFSIKKNNGKDMGWTQYTCHLDNFVNHSCVILLFESMRMSLPQFDGEQYIDRIKLNADQDLAINPIPFPDISSCHFTEQKLNLILSSLTAQNINFADYPTSLQVDISGATTKNYTIPLRSGTVLGLNDYIVVIDSNFDFYPGTYYIYAKIMTPVDQISANDILYDTLIIHPAMDVTISQITNSHLFTDCIVIGTHVNQTVSVKNNGNINMDSTILTLNLYDITGKKIDCFSDSIYSTITADDSLIYTFAKPYLVPNDEIYSVEVIASQSCNPSFNYSDVISECVDQNDVAVTDILYPLNDNACHNVGENIKAKVRVLNRHPYENAQGIVLHVVTKTENSTITHWTETLNDIASNSYLDFEVPQSFKIPNNAYFTITAFINTIDANPDNDTLSLTKCTDLDIDEDNCPILSLSQNIPNPAYSQTKVDYNVPESGTVVFSITNITGQILYQTSQEAIAGKNCIFLNIENLSAGIYFYTMLFNGQQITKKMTIKNNNHDTRLF